MPARSTTASQSSRPQNFGAVRFNAPGIFGGVDFSADDRSLITVIPGDEQTRVCRFRVADGELEEERTVSGRWNAVVVPHDGGLLLRSHASLARLDPAGNVVWSLERESDFWSANRGGTLVTTYGRDSAAHVFDARTGALLHTVREPNGEIFAFAFSPDGSRFATGGQKGIVRVFDRKTAEELAHRSSTKVLALSFSSDGELLAGGHGNGDIRVWKVPSLKPLSSFRGAAHRFLEDYGRGEQDMGPAGCRWLAFASGGADIVSAGNDHYLRWWNLDGSPKRRVRIHGRHPQGAQMAIANGGQTIAAGTTASSLSVWNESGDPVVDEEGLLPPRALRLTADRLLVSSSDGLWSWNRDGRARPTRMVERKAPNAQLGKAFLLDEAGDSSKPAVVLELPSPRGAFSLSHGAKLVSAPVDTSAEWWDQERGARAGSIPHDVEVLACAFGPGDEWLVTVADAVRVWLLVDVETPIRTVAFEDGAPAICGGLAVSPRGWIAISIDRSTSNHSSDSALLFIDPRSGALTATLAHPRWRLGQVAFVDDTRAVVVDSAGTLLMADAEKGCWLEIERGGARTHGGVPGSHGFRPLPLAVSEDGSEVAYVDAWHNVSIYEVAKSEATNLAPFVLDGGTKARAPTSTEPSPMFENRLAGTTFMFIGNFSTSSLELRTTAEFREVTVRELGGSVTTKPKGVTHFVVARKPYVPHKATATETTIHALVAKGEPIVELNERQMIELLLPTLQEARAMLRGEIPEGIERWNRWRSRYRDLAGGFARLTGIDLAGADLRKAELSVIHFEEARLAGANLAGVNLYDCVFRGADLRGANLDGANCGRVEFANADLRDAKVGANLAAARFEGADLRGADLRNADLTYCKLEGARLEGAKLPASFDASTKNKP